MIYIILSGIKTFVSFCGKILSVCFNASILLETFKDFKISTLFFVCFCKAFRKRRHVNLTCFIIWLQLEDNIFSLVRYSSLSILLDYNADIFATSLLISYCSFSAKRLFPKGKGLSDARVVSITKEERGFVALLCKYL